MKKLFHFQIIGILLVFNFSKGFSQIYTGYVTSEEIDTLLNLDKKVEIPTFDIQGLTLTEIEQLKLKNKSREEQGKTYSLAVPISAAISTSRHGVWTNSGKKRLWLLNIKTNNATMIAPAFERLSMLPNSEIWIFTSDKKLLMGPIKSSNIPQNLNRVTTDFLPKGEITIALFADKEYDTHVSLILKSEKNI